MGDVHVTDRPRTAQRIWVRPATLGAGAILGTAAIAALNPTDGATSVCVSSSVLGIDCPLCGGLRCVNSLARGDWLTAADHNVLLAVVLPVAAVGLLVWLVSALRGRTVRLPTIANGWWIGAAGVVAVFTVARNLGTSGWIGWLAATGVT